MKFPFSVACRINQQFYSHYADTHRNPFLLLVRLYMFWSWKWRLPEHFPRRSNNRWIFIRFWLYASLYSRGNYDYDILKISIVLPQKGNQLCRVTQGCESSKNFNTTDTKHEVCNNKAAIPSRYHASSMDSETKFWFYQWTWCE